MKIYEYKGYKAKIAYSKEDSLYYGELINTKDTITFHSKSVDQIEDKFQNAVNYYLIVCEKLGKLGRQSDDNDI